MIKRLIYKIRIGKKNILKHLFIAMLLILLLSKIRGNSYNLSDIADNMFIISLIYVIIALFGIVIRLRFFDLTIYGIKKVIEITFNKDQSDNTSKTGSYTDYLKTLNHTKPIFTFVFIAISLVICSYFLTVISSN